MANPLYEMLTGRQQMPQQTPMMNGMQFMNPLQKAQYILNTLRNPSMFARQAFPDIPEEIANDPNQVLAYIQKTRGISNAQIQQILQRFPR